MTKQLTGISGVVNGVIGGIGHRVSTTGHKVQTTITNYFVNEKYFLPINSVKIGGKIYPTYSPGAAQALADLVTNVPPKEEWETKYNAARNLGFNNHSQSVGSILPPKQPCIVMNTEGIPEDYLDNILKKFETGQQEGSNSSSDSN